MIHNPHRGPVRFGGASRSSVMVESEHIDGLRVEVDGERISVSLTGTNFRIIYFRYECGLAQSPVMAQDCHSDVPRTEFERIAWAAATEKA